MTSHDCVAIVRRATGVKRVGHTGTLDPMATGVLPICIGRSARVMDYTDLDKKEYRCEFKLGVKTDTMDIWGEVLEEVEPTHVTFDEVRSKALNFLGEIRQVPPMYSALKVNGRKLYEYAREGKEVDIKPRKVNIYELEIEKVEFPTITMRVLCSKGTYIRSLCTDFGEALGNLATMTALERTKSGRFNVDDSINIFDIKEMEKEEIAKLLLAADYPLMHFGKIFLNDRNSYRFLNGMKIAIKEIIIEEPEIEIEHKEFANKYRIYDKSMFIGIGKVEEGMLRVDKMLF